MLKAKSVNLSAKVKQSGNKRYHFDFCCLIFIYSYAILPGSQAFKGGSEAFILQCNFGVNSLQVQLNYFLFYADVFAEDLY